MRLLPILIVLLFTSAGLCSGQSCKTEAKFINNKADLQRSIQNDPAKKMVALKKMIPGLLIELPYATANNFTKSILYYHPVACMRIAPATALQKIQAELNKKGFALKIYDAFRPFSVTCRMWHMVRDKRYVANPKAGSNHNRGLAVDLTIIDMKTCKELDMGTAFDNFTDTASQLFMQLPAQVLANRMLLRSIMRKYGFGIFYTEWWHYQWRNNDDYEVLDLDFDDLKDIL